MKDAERNEILEELDEIEASLKAIRRVLGGKAAPEDVDDGDLPRSDS